MLNKIRSIKRFVSWTFRVFIHQTKLGGFGKNTVLENPIFIEYPKFVFIEDNARLRNYCTIINSPSERVVIKKYSVIAAGVTIITNSHRSTVGIPQICLGASHINDKSGDVIIEEDVWVGANATIMPGVTIGRGAIVSAGAIVTHNVPPYALVAGIPARIVAKKFELEDVIRHEEMIYSPEERISNDKLREIFEQQYKGKKAFGINSPLSTKEKKLLNRIKEIYHVHLPSDADVHF